MKATRATAESARTGTRSDCGPPGTRLAPDSVGRSSGLRRAVSESAQSATTQVSASAWVLETSLRRMLGSEDTTSAATASGTSTVDARDASRGFSSWCWRRQSALAKSSTRHAGRTPQTGSAIGVSGPWTARTSAGPSTAAEIDAPTPRAFTDARSHPATGTTAQTTTSARVRSASANSGTDSARTRDSAGSSGWATAAMAPALSQIPGAAASQSRLSTLDARGSLPCRSNLAVATPAAKSTRKAPPKATKMDAPSQFARTSHTQASARTGTPK
ncbi:hypothetical protein ACFPRL_07315 [Pseudoclavibacter helvolus]